MPSRTGLHSCLRCHSYGALSSSLKPVNELFLWPPRLLPKTWSWQNYVEIWEVAPLARFFVNTVIVTVLTVTGRVLSSSFVAYGFARFRFPYRNFLFILVLSTLMLPYQVTIIPNFLLFKALGWLDTYNPLVIPHWLGGGAFSIFCSGNSSIRFLRTWTKRRRLMGRIRFGYSYESSCRYPNR